MRKQWRFILLLLLILTVVSACGEDGQVAETDTEPEDQQPEQTEETESESEPEPEPEPKEPTYKNVYPLTGVGTNEEVNDRAVAVMVNNHPSARPQTGLTKADIIFEILAEGNITRFMAVFHSEKPEVVGPVRSARPYYFNLADDYGALYVYHGAAHFIENMLRAGAADYLNGAYYDNDGHLFKRESFRVAPHNSYLQFDAVYEVAQEQGYKTKAEHTALPFLTEEEADEINGSQAEEVSYAYSQTPVRYVYDSTSEKYLRFNGESQSVELETEEAIKLDNVFFIETYHEVTDSAGRREIDLQSGGDGYLLQKGKVQEVQWKNVDGQILPFDGDKAIGFVPGKTWVNVVPTGSGLEAVSIQ